MLEPRGIFEETELRELAEEVDEGDIFGFGLAEEFEEVFGRLGDDVVAEEGFAEAGVLAVGRGDVFSAAGVEEFEDFLDEVGAVFGPDRYNISK